MTGLVRWFAHTDARLAQQDVVTTSVAMTMHGTYPLNDAAKADADRAMRETTGSTVLLLYAAVSRRSFQGIDAC